MPSVLATSYAQHRIVIADNASTDDSIAFLKRECPQVEIIAMPQNTGFAKGYNIALQEVDSEYVVLLNSDVEVSPDWLNPLVAYLEKNPDVAAIQPKICAFDDKKRFEYAGAVGGFMDRLGYPFCRGRIMDYCELDEGQYDSPMDVFWVSGAAMLVRKSVFENLGGFDADYFAHMEEIDWCWRVQRAGYRLAVVPQSVVYHVGGGTLAYVSPRKTYLNFRNSLFTLFKNESWLTLFWLIPLRLVLDGIAGIRFLFQGKIRHVGAIIWAHWMFYFNFFRLLKKRNQYNQHIQKNKKARPRIKGRCRRVLIWEYFIKGNKRYSDMV